MTQFALVSDLHGVLPVFSYDTKDTVLICPGDIHEVHRKAQFRTMLADLCSRFKTVITTAGNHEYYGTNIQSAHHKLRAFEEEFSNYFFLQDEFHMVEDDIMIIGSTLWTSLCNHNPIVMYDAETKMNDYKHIRHGPPDYGWKRKLSTVDTMMFHRESTEYIKETIEYFKSIPYPEVKKVLVMSHHAPSFQSVSPQYLTDDLNGAYCSNLDDMIIELKPTVWVHGHVHDSFDYMIEDTRVLCNPQGYELRDGSFENKSFNPNFTFTL